MGEKTEAVQSGSAAQPKPQPQVPALEIALMSAIGMNNMPFAAFTAMVKRASTNGRSIAQQAHYESSIVRNYTYAPSARQDMRETMLLMRDEKLGTEVHAVITEGDDPNDIQVFIEKPKNAIVGGSVILRADIVYVIHGDESWAKVAENCYIIHDSRLANEPTQWWWPLDILSWCHDKNQTAELVKFLKATGRRIGNLS